MAPERVTSVRGSVIAACVMLSACVFEETYVPGPPPTPVPDLVEDRHVYDQDGLEVLTVRLTVTDLEALAAVQDDVPDASAPVLFQEGSYGAGLDVPNGTIQLRGSSSRSSDLHSYKVKLSGAGWRGLTKLNLLKHPYDLTRLRNRLSFEYMRSIPNFTSLRLQFVHLFLNGEDLGLYENIENPGKAFLDAHGLVRGELYKANNFAFYPLTAAQLADPKLREDILESKGVDADPTKLDQLLRDINDPTLDTDRMFATHFNVDNYVTWLAINVLFGNADTSNQNFMIYSPPDTEGWYFLPWDFDGAWGFNGPDGQPGTTVRARTRVGLATWWLVPLHQRFLRDPKNVALLDAKMDELMGSVLGDDTTRAMLARYHDVVRPYITQAPDVDHLPDNHSPTRAASVAAWETEVDRIGGHLRRARDEYDAVRGRPMPIYLADPEPGAQPGTLVFRWDASFQLAGQRLTYDLEVSRTPMFGAGDLVVAESGMTSTTLTAPALPAGQYYWRVVTRAGDAPDNWQDCAETYYDASRTKFPGVRALTIP